MCRYSRHEAADEVIAASERRQVERLHAWLWFCRFFLKRRGRSGRWCRRLPRSKPPPANSRNDHYKAHHG